MRSLICCLLILAAPCSWGQGVNLVKGVEAQPLLAQVARLEQALDTLGHPLSPEDQRRLQALYEDTAPGAAEAVQEILDPYCIAVVNVNPEMRVKVARGPVEAGLVQYGWSSYLVKVHNEAGTKASLQIESPNALPVLHRSTGRSRPLEKNLIGESALRDRFLEAVMYHARPMTSTLSGLGLEYQIVQFYTKELGAREAQLAFHLGEGTKDLALRYAIPVLFDCRPAVKVVLRVKDHDGKPTTASFVVRDGVERLTDDPGGKVFPRDYRHERARRLAWDAGRGPVQAISGIYPLPARRVASQDEYPDFFFQPQIYRADGEHIYLPPGQYEVTWTRGPEYLTQRRVIDVPEGTDTHEESFELERWTHLAERGWYSVDHHVHAGGCSHYESPEAGVDPAAMYRQAVGEDLNIACVLTWGPCWYHQKEFFEGRVHDLSTSRNVMRYDVEVSGFPSSHAGHICLLGLTEDDYPDTTQIEQWPSWTLPVLQWAKSQGGVVGYAHSGWGLEPQETTESLPNYVIPKFDGIGANEFIVTVAHDAVDFISTVDTPPNWELNIWYHTLNCGFRTRISGETDYPCIYDDRVGMGRSYVKLGKDLNFDAYTRRLRQGANYVSDGKSHILDFSVDEAIMGEGESELHLDAARSVTVRAKVAAMLPEAQDVIAVAIANERGQASQPYWDIEKARIAESRKVPVELIVNGYPVARQEIEADGDFRDIEFAYPIGHSSWVALRVLPSSHTNPVFVLVDGKPIRASKRSAEWCMASVDRCWEMKESAIRPGERDQAKKAYEEARSIYERILIESVAD